MKLLTQVLGQTRLAPEASSSGVLSSSTAAGVDNPVEASKTRPVSQPPDAPPDTLPSFMHSSERGELRIWLAGPTVLMFRYRGHADGSYIDFVEDVYRRTLADTPGLIQVFVDAEHQTGYDRPFLAGISRWGKHVLPRTNIYCLLVRSRLVAMGITIARVLAGEPSHLRVVTDRNAFRSELELAVRRSFAQHSGQAATEA